jgi:hypothetical protein
MAQRDVAQNVNFRFSHRASIFFYWWIIISFYMAFMTEVFWGESRSFWILSARFIFSIVFFRFHYRALKELYYSFWGFGSLLLSYLIYCFISSLAFEELLSPKYFYFFSLLVFAFICYLISTPVYYPIFNWWEYDFRYRHDLRGELRLSDDSTHEVRLTDLRRAAACLICFCELPVPTYAQLEIILEGKQISLPVILTTTSETIPGRGFSYGVMFNPSTKEDKQELKQLMNSWREESEMKHKEKFKIIKRI